MSDLDIVDCFNDFAENIWCEYTYAGNETPVVAITDYKKVVKGKTEVILGQNSPQRWMASRCEIPFFIALCYLDPSYPVKMYYVIPGNDKARAFFTKLKLDWQGKWMTLLRFSFFQYKLRGKDWQPDYQVKDKAIDAIKMLDPAAPLRHGMKLKDLPNKLETYYIPPMKERE